MSKFDKNIKRLIKKPTPTDITEKELKNTLNQLGFKETKRYKGRVKFEFEEIVIKYHVPYGPPTFKQYVINDIVKILKNNKFI